MKRIFTCISIVISGLALTTFASLSVGAESENDGLNKMRIHSAKKRHLEGDAAISFIDKYFPDVITPGHVEGSFNYLVNEKTGYAKCFYPAMGGRSMGVEVTCELRESGRVRTLTGDAAATFIDTNFSNATIPGSFEGKYKYGGTTKTGYAKCFYPAKGGRSMGVEVTCDIEYK